MIYAITSITYEYTLFHHWWKYYRSLGVEKFIVAVGNFIIPTLPQCFKQEFGHIEGLEIISISERFRATGYEGADKEEIRIKHISPKDWFIPADLDEFIQFPDTLPNLIAQIQKDGSSHITGHFVDRITRSGKLTQDVPDIFIWEQYPQEADISKDLVKCYCTKVVLVKGSVPLVPGNHFVLDGSKCIKANCRIHHFKWRANLAKALKRRVYYYQQHNIEWIPESLRVLEYIEKNGRILPKEFNARPGWIPDRY